MNESTESQSNNNDNVQTKTEKTSEPKANPYLAHTYNNTTNSDPQKNKPYGNYMGYYQRRNDATVKDDPRLEVFDKSFFERKEVLDIGCNSGEFTIEIATRFLPEKILGIDIDDKLIERAYSNVRQKYMLLLPNNDNNSSGRNDNNDEIAGSNNNIESESKDDNGKLSGQSNNNTEITESDNDFINNFENDNKGKNNECQSGSSTHPESLSSSSENVSGSIPVPCERSFRKRNFPAEEAESSSFSTNYANNNSAKKNPAKKIKPEQRDETKNDDSLVAIISNHRSCSTIQSTSTIIAGPSKMETDKKSLDVDDESVHFPHNILFRCADWMKETIKKEKYDTILALSITKWIHLHYGDSGIKEFFCKIYDSLKPGGIFLIEPQPWSSYRKYRHISETHNRNYNNTNFFPKDFHGYLLKEIGYTSCRFLNVVEQRGLEKGLRRDIIVYTK
ncbi:11266_t:CDS:2 [Ambispora gerdemannii]|uniref:RNA methyltransferase n=1 Tax=Ambispora gerdemannii TaxID=144530 RepID=A0A9N8V1U4_9GLOM|nr:11266_t:CDS:2 [Ambispora gerdemannii]